MTKQQSDFAVNLSEMLLTFFMDSMSAAKTAVFLEFKLPRGVFLILGSCIIFMFTLSA